jgi:hypothetical protein
MKKYEIIYDWVTAELTRIVDSDEAEAFAITLAEPLLTSFTALADQAKQIRDDLRHAKAAKDVYPRWSDLRLLIAVLERDFPNFPNLNPVRLTLALILQEKLSQTIQAAAGGGPVLDEANVQETLFELRPQSSDLSVPWFVWENPQSFPDSVALFSTRDRAMLTTQVVASNIRPELMFHLLARMHAATNELSPLMVMVKRENPSISDDAVDAFARLTLLMSGKAVHQPRMYKATAPQVIEPGAVRAGVEYQQLNDVFYVLSEYNDRREILTKYLTLYHVIENFMFKFPIVSLERTQGGRMFSIRDFRRLYREIDTAELSALKKLFAAIFAIHAKPGTTFKTKIEARWLAFCHTKDVPDVEKLLSKLNITFGYSTPKFSRFRGSSSATYFAQMVYATRNVIVHNTETEWHLSYATMDEATCLLLEGFLMPSLEEICFALVGKKNNHVWYSNKSLALY